MEIKVCKDYAELSRYAADRVVAQLTAKPDSVLGLCTGSTPEGTYACLAEDYAAGRVSFAQASSYNLDEYYPLAADHEQSYHYFMEENLFGMIDIPRNQIHILDGMAQNTSDECKDYEEKISAFGGIDIQLAGIGENGHLAFNEPGTSFQSLTHEQKLTDNTIEVNSRFFEKKEDVPTSALTIGLKTIFDAKKVIVMATGEKKAEAVYKSVRKSVSESCPASILQNHANAVFVCDSCAGKNLK